MCLMTTIVVCSPGSQRALRNSPDTRRHTHASRTHKAGLAGERTSQVHYTNNAIGVADYHTVVSLMYYRPIYKELYARVQRPFLSLDCNVNAGWGRSACLAGIVFASSLGCFCAPSKLRTVRQVATASATAAVAAVAVERHGPRDAAPWEGPLTTGPLGRRP
ncbi:unnamed protein product [Chrysodeixis includens]|uniref:Uncharacterized protein n=1 Tax=Chrysodeixis includens TaxID=689277 RepID=A0A9N8KSV6_CHRIL|nr:unnamed protein product [Chrysodeixis includens]